MYPPYQLQHIAGLHNPSEIAFEGSIQWTKVEAKNREGVLIFHTYRYVIY